MVPEDGKRLFNFPNQEENKGLTFGISETEAAPRPTGERTTKSSLFVGTRRHHKSYCTTVRLPFFNKSLSNDYILTGPELPCYLFKDQGVGQHVRRPNRTTEHTGTGPRRGTLKSTKVKTWSCVRVCLYTYVCVCSVSVCFSGPVVPTLRVC